MSHRSQIAVTMNTNYYFKVHKMKQNQIYVIEYKMTRNMYYFLVNPITNIPR